MYTSSGVADLSAKRSERALKNITIDWGGPSPSHSDIDKTKRFFRSRGWVGDFFAATGAAEGDAVIIYCISQYYVRVRLEKV